MIAPGLEPTREAEQRSLQWLREHADCTSPARYARELALLLDRCWQDGRAAALAQQQASQAVTSVEQVYEARCSACGPLLTSPTWATAWAAIVAHEAAGRHARPEA